MLVNFYSRIFTTPEESHFLYSDGYRGYKYTLDSHQGKESNQQLTNHLGDRQIIISQLEQNIFTLDKREKRRHSPFTMRLFNEV